ncbi:MAG TPA: TMEM175 family protein [Pseudonocardia sp.]|nr:TMEM175 family protein [Pseudonocardia sp.]
MIAIAITLLVLGLDVPSGLDEAGLAGALRDLGPQLFSFLLSFLVIGRFWISHHRLFRHVRYYDDRLLVLNGAFLSSVAFLPFPTSLLGEYMHHRSALVVYALSVAASGLAFSLLWAHAAYGGHLMAEDLDPRLRRSLLLRSLSVPVPFLASVPLAAAGLFYPAAAMWIVLPPVARSVLRWQYHRTRLRTQPGTTASSARR